MTEGFKCFIMGKGRQGMSAGGIISGVRMGLMNEGGKRGGRDDNKDRKGE